MTKTARVLRLSPEDNILVAGERIDKDASVGEGVTARQRIPFGHKIAARRSPRASRCASSARSSASPASRSRRATGCTSTMSACTISTATTVRRGGAAGEHPAGRGAATFEGFRRANGKVGTRNYLGILTSVNCSATVARFIAEEINRSGILDDYPEHRRRRAVRARHRLRHGPEGRRLRGAAAHAVGLCHQSQSRRRAAGRARLRGVPDRRA